MLCTGLNARQCLTVFLIISFWVTAIIILLGAIQLLVPDFVLEDLSSSVSSAVKLNHNSPPDAAEPSPACHHCANASAYPCHCLKIRLPAAAVSTNTHVNNNNRQKGSDRLTNLSIADSYLQSLERIRTRLRRSKSFCNQFLPHIFTDGLQPDKCQSRTWVQPSSSSSSQVCQAVGMGTFSIGIHCKKEPPYTPYTPSEISKCSQFATSYACNHSRNTKPEHFAMKLTLMEKPRFSSAVTTTIPSSWAKAIRNLGKEALIGCQASLLKYYHIADLFVEIKDAAICAVNEVVVNSTTTITTSTAPISSSLIDLKNNLQKKELHPVQTFLRSITVANSSREDSHLKETNLLFTQSKLASTLFTTFIAMNMVHVPNSPRDPCTNFANVPIVFEVFYAVIVFNYVTDYSISDLRTHHVGWKQVPFCRLYLIEDLAVMFPPGRMVQLIDMGSYRTHHNTHETAKSVLNMAYYFSMWAFEDQLDSEAKEFYQWSMQPEIISLPPIEALYRATQFVIHRFPQYRFCPIPNKLSPSVCQNGISTYPTNSSNSSFFNETRFVSQRKRHNSKGYSTDYLWSKTCVSCDSQTCCVSTANNTPWRVYHVPPDSEVARQIALTYADERIFNFHWQEIPVSVPR